MTFSLDIIGTRIVYEGGKKSALNITSVQM